MPDTTKLQLPESRGTKSALVTGITGQDGAYLTELLLEKATRYTASCGGRARSTPDASTTSIMTDTPRDQHLPCTTVTSMTERH
jgi:GDP-D-mannose dehydratase